VGVGGYRGGMSMFAQPVFWLVLAVAVVALVVWLVVRLARRG